MRSSLSGIVDCVLDTSLENHRTYENEHFIYWIQDSFSFNVDVIKNIPKKRLDEFMSSNDQKREYFKKLENYVVKNKRFPKYYDEYIYSKETSKTSTILRYSKTYGNLEFYITTKVISSNYLHNNGKVLVMKKREKRFSVNQNDRVRILDGKRWLSLKNWQSIYLGSDRLNKELMRVMLDGIGWLDKLPETNMDIENKYVRGCKTMHEVLVKANCKIPKSLSNFFKNPYECINLEKIIDIDQVHHLTNFIKKNKYLMLKISENKRVTADGLLYLYFLSKHNGINRRILKDYIQILLSIGKKINLDISSHNTLRRKHDEASVELMMLKNKNKVDYNLSEDFPIIKSDELLFERIEDSDRLNLESATLHHCVHSYDGRIKNGSTSIYNVTFNGKSYTLELQKELKPSKISDIDGIEEVGDDYSILVDKMKESRNNYTIKAVQLKGKYNSAPPTDMEPILSNVLREYGIDMCNSLFKDSTRERQFLVNNGVKYLERFIDTSGDITLYVDFNNKEYIPGYIGGFGELPF